MTEICPQDTYWMTVWCLYRVWSTKNLLCCPCLLFTSLVIVIRILAISLMSELKNSFKTTMQRMPNPVLFYFLCEKRSMDRMSLGNSYVQWKWNVIWNVKCQNKKILYKMFVIFILRIIHVILLENCRNGLMLNYWRCWQLHRNVVLQGNFHLITAKYCTYVIIVRKWSFPKSPAQITVAEILCKKLLT